MNEWLKLMLEEVRRKQREREREAAAREDRRRATTLSESASRGPGATPGPDQAGRD